MLFYKSLTTRLGEMLLVFDETSVHGLFWQDQITKEINGDDTIKDYLEKKAESVFKHNCSKIKSHPMIDNVQNQLNEYFNGVRKEFDIPLKALGSEFQMKAWNQLRKIKYGTTQSYLNQAISIKSPKAHRAVGTANSKNPISILIPCHRVVASDGKLSGYAGGSDRKAALLNLEKKV